MINIANGKSNLDINQQSSLTPTFTNTDAQLTTPSNIYNRSSNNFAPLNAPLSSGNGLRGEYYDNIDFTNLKLTRTDANINFNFGNGSPDPSIAPDTFSVRWTGQVEALFTEAYTFFATSDDGVRLWVNGQQIINNFRIQGVREVASTTINLVAGQKYDIRLDYFENTGQAVSRLAWSSASQVKQIISQSQLYSPIPPSATLNASSLNTGGGNSYTFTVNYSDDVAVNIASLDNSDIRVTGTNGFNQLATLVSIDSNTNGTPRIAIATYQIDAPGGVWDATDNGNYTIALQGNQVSDIDGNVANAGTLGSFSVGISGIGTGLVGEYYDNIDFTNLKLTRTDRNIDFNFGSGSPDSSIGADTFSIRWTGQVEAKFSETYRFFTTSDDGVRLWVNGQQIINNFRDQSAREVASTPIALVAGQKYDIRLDYYENRGNAVSRLTWSSQSQVKQIIPQSQLYSPDAIAPTATASATTLTTGGDDTYTFSITYSDNNAVNISTLDSNDIRVIGPNGFNQLASFVSVDSTSNGSPTIATYSINAPGDIWNATNNGSYTITLEANQVSDINGNFASLATLGSFLVSIAGTGTGLKGDYYDNINFTNLNLTRTDVTVNYDWGAGSPDVSIAPDTFSVRWTGRIEPKYTETYTFYTTTDDGVRLRVNGQTVIDKFIDQPPTQWSGQIALEAGKKYDIQIEYYENGGGALAKLEWSSITQVREVISSTQLYLPVVLPTIRLGQPPSSVAEGDPSIQIEVLRIGEDLSGTSTIKYKTEGENATAGLDYTEVSGTLTFAPGETSKFVTIPILQDLISELDETLTFIVDQPQGANLGTQRTTRITIDDDDRTDLTFTQPIVNESDGNAVVVVKRGLSTDAASVNYTTIADTARTNSDYQPISGTLNFAPGERSKTILIPILNDTIGEPNEKFTLQFSNAMGVGLNIQDKSEITIIDDDPGNFSRSVVVNGLTEPTAFDWLPNGSGNSNRLLIAQKNGIVRVAENGNLLATPFIDISGQVNDVRDRGLLGLAIHPDFPNTPYVYLLFTYDPPEVYNNVNPNTNLDDPDGAGNRPSRLIRVTADPATNYTTAIVGSEVILLGNNSTWALTSRPDGNSTNILEDANGNIDFAANFAPSGIVNQSGNLFTNMQDYYNNLSNLTNVEDYLATDSESHSIGDLAFGSDGSLFVSNGDGASYNRVDPRAIRVQDINNLSGKILRIDPITGAGLSDNPFYDASNANSNRSKVFNYGLRNPFRLTIDKTNNTPYIGDVGWTTWEEVNAGKGKNFGWPYFEGGDGINLQQPSYATLVPAQQFYTSGQPVTAPIYAYQHFGGSNAIIMGDFYTGNTFPSIYRNGLFIADAAQSTVDFIKLDSQGQFVSIQRFDQGIGQPVQIKTGPDGNLYYIDINRGTTNGSVSVWRPIT